MPSRVTSATSTPASKSDATYAQTGSSMVESFSLICSNRFIHDGDLLSHQEAVHAAVIGAKNRHKKPKMNRK
ncbi:hypothetical protein Q3G72_003418 [Acer saccharum]|nr:hypothetical protein Q3G72_003418 [Acer saccharum]